jgi:uncharacterized protein YfaS (alpha-2-macroglobulin family)
LHFSVGRIWPFVLAVAFRALLACAGPRVPAAEIDSKLQVAAPRHESQPAPSDARVVFFSPNGEASAAAEIAVVFDRPVRALDEAARPIRATIEPRVAGSWEWIGTRALHFQPVQPLPAATRFSVTIPRDTPELAGVALKAAHRWSFTTPRPALVSCDPEPGAEPLPRDAVFELRFNLPVEPSAVASSVSLRVEGSDAPLAFAVEHPQSDPPEQVVLKPRAPLPEGKRLRLSIAPSLQSSAGPLAAAHASELSFVTAEPLRVVSSSCRPSPNDTRSCAVESPLLLRLTGDVDPELLERAIAFDPPLRFAVQLEPDAKNEGSYVVEADFEPQRTYRMKLRRKSDRAIVRDGDGRALVADHENRFRFGDRAPTLSISGGGTYWPADKKLSLEVQAANVHAVRVRGALLDVQQVLARLRSADSKLLPPSISFEKTLDLPNPSTSQFRSSFISPDRLVETDARGPLLVAASYRTQDGGEHTTIKELQLTNLAIVSTVTHDHAALWVSDLASQQPVSGASIELFRLDGTAIARGRTDADGMLELALTPELSSAPDQTASGVRPARWGAGDSKPIDGRPRFVAFVRHGRDLAYQVLTARRRPQPVGTIFTERGLYRRGESVQLKGYVRRPGPQGLTAPNGETVTLSVSDESSQKEVSRLSAKLSRFGSFHRALKLPQNSRLGLYAVRLELDGEIATTRFAVADYEPADFTVETKPEKSEYVRGDTMTCISTGRYLYGAPMAGAKLRVAVSRSPDFEHEPPALHGFVVGDSTAPEPPGSVANVETSFDRLGVQRISRRLALPGMTNAESVACDVYASDLDTREISASATVLVHPAEMYVGVKEPPDPIRPGRAFRTSVHAVDLSGASAALPVRVSLIRRTQLDDVTTPQDEELARCDVTTGSRPVECKFSAPNGEYEFGRRFLIVRANATDRRGNPVVSSYSVVPEPAPVTPAPGRPGKTADEPPLSVEIANDGMPDDARFEVGQKAMLRVRSPWKRAATVLVSVLRENVLWRKRMPLPPGQSVVSFEVTRAMQPNATIEVLGVLGETSVRASTDLTVSTRDKVLTVELEPLPKRARPGQTIDVAVRVLDAGGRPVRAEVALYAADEATLSLAHYQLPDPLHIHGARFGDVAWLDARQMLFSPRRPPNFSTRKAMGANLLMGPSRGDFRQTAFYHPALLTDTAGRIRQRVKLPDGLTTYRIMAVAATEDDRFGAQETTLTTSQPLMVRPKLPAVIRVGDRFRLAAIVSAKRRSNVALRASVRGLALSDSPAKRALLDQDVPRRVDFAIEARKVGPFSVAVQAAGADGELRDNVELRGMVVPPTFIEETTVANDAHRTTALGLAGLSQMRRDVGELTVTLSRSRLAGLDADLNHLFEYPYGCTEQTASRLLPIASLRGLLEEIGVPIPRDSSSRVQSGVDRLLSHQQADGGFGAWPESRSTQPWLTAYALFGLDQARRSGARVSAGNLDRAATALLRNLQAVTSDPSRLATADPGALTAAAFAADVLAGVGKPRPQEIRILFDARQQMPASAQALLLHAMSFSERGSPQSALLESELLQKVESSKQQARVPLVGDAPWQSALMESEIRSTAFALRALLASRPRHPLVEKLVNGLFTQLLQRDRVTTQDSAWALLALDAYRRTHPSAGAAADARVFLDEKLRARARLDAATPLHTLTIPAAELAAARKLTFDAGDGTVHYRARLRFARAELPTTPIDAGISVHKVNKRVASYGATPSAPSSRFREGDLVRVDVYLMTNTTRHFVVIEDAIPGGFRALDPSLHTGVVEKEPQAWDHRELRDDRVLFFADELAAGVTKFTYFARAQTAGSFVAPPTQAYEMYAPDARGATAAGRVEVASR